ncbi:hypothetical protein JI750_04095 [Flavobacterium sp. GN10]|uniref:Uncharacterized protein n=1 Tax=Flavobacterium tagetis TaxID=2801336 RepID=A0ABS1K9C6_9FLAO|nr:DUF6625 family protein [Flavobacterium tagetis]MBL0736053.1 hypothetical protein [Flavobacterium tagetis]
MKISPSIAILTCWYGDYPWYLPYFIKSCKYNPSIDFVIITENKTIIPNKPSNVIVVNKSFDEFKNNASFRLGFQVALDTPYKLNDFKPAYGFLFPEIISKYDFWGHADIDMVYGNIRGFMTDELLQNYDILTSREDFIMGTFCLFRNNQQMNTLFMKSRDYRYILTNEQYFSFDECNFLFEELGLGHSILDYPNNLQSMTYLAKKGNKEGSFKAFFDRLIIRGMSNKIRWDNGLIIYDDKFECLFYDMIDYKVKCKNKNASSTIPDIFYFNEKGIKIVL